MYSQIHYVLDMCCLVVILWAIPLNVVKRKAAEIALQHIGEMPPLSKANTSDYATKEHVMDKARIFFVNPMKSLAILR